MAAEEFLTTYAVDEYLVEKLVNSELYTTFHEAFSLLTGLPLALQPKDHWFPPLQEEKLQNPICKLIAQDSKACSFCLSTQAKLLQAAKNRGQSEICPVGMVDIAVPVSVNGKLIAFLYSGQLLPQSPSKEHTDIAVQKIEKLKLGISAETIIDLYKKSKVISNKKQSGIIKLLTQFASQLSGKANLILLQSKNDEPELIQKAKKYIASNLLNKITLADVAKHVNVSPFYFCRIFKKFTKLKFTDYVTRTRVEMAKNILLKYPNKRVSEIAYYIGFQSIAHFNRSFKRCTGYAPRNWREKNNE